MSTFAAKLAPWIFVILWSTGFIGSKLGAPYIEPFVFLTIRFLVVILILSLVLTFIGNWTSIRRSTWLHCLIAGLLIHGVYLGGIFWVIDRGMPAGVTSLVLGLQPFLTALLAGPVLGETITRRHWAGLAIGAVGLAFVIAPKLALGADGMTPVTVGVCLAAVAAIAAGTVYQKRYAADVGLLPGTTLQYAGALLFVGPLSAFEAWTIEWSADLVFALVWLIVVLSIGAVFLLMLLIRHGSAAKVSALFYLVPVATAVESFFLFGETLSHVQFLGMALVIGAMMMVQRRRSV